MFCWLWTNSRKCLSLSLMGLLESTMKCKQLPYWVVTWPLLQFTNLEIFHFSCQVRVKIVQVSEALPPQTWKGFSTAWIYLFHLSNNEGNQAGNSDWSNQENYINWDEDSLLKNSEAWRSEFAGSFSPLEINSENGHPLLWATFFLKFLIRVLLLILFSVFEWQSITLASADVP